MIPTLTTLAACSAAACLTVTLFGALRYRSYEARQLPTCLGHT